MDVGDEKIALILAGVLQVNEIFERAQIVADVQSARGLDAGDEDGVEHSRIINDEFLMSNF